MRTAVRLVVLALVVATAPAAAAGSSGCPLIRDARGDAGDGVVAGSYRDGLDVVAGDLLAGPAGVRTRLWMAGAPRAEAGRSSLYNVQFTVGPADTEHTFQMHAWVSATSTDFLVVRMAGGKSDATPATVRISGRVVPEQRMVEATLPMAVLASLSSIDYSSRPPRRVGAISASTATYAGDAALVNVHVGSADQATGRPTAFGARGCSA